MGRITGTLVTFGDSITSASDGGGATTRYATLTASAKGFTLSNQGVASYQIHEVLNKIYENYLSIVSKNQFSIMVGFNDMRQQGINTTTRGFYKNALMGGAAFLALPATNKVTGQDASIIYSGSWSDSTLYSTPNLTAKDSTTLNDTATFTATGSVVYICMGSWNGGTGVVNVSVDSVSKGSFNLFDSYTSVLGATAHSFLIRITGLTDIAHTVVLTVGVNSGKTTFVWGGGNHGITLQNSPDIYVANILKMTTVGYATGGAAVSNGSDAAVALYNTDILSAVNTLYGDGLSVNYVDVSSALDPNANTISNDNVHPNNAGQTAISTAFIKEMFSSYRRIRVV